MTAANQAVHRAQFALYGLPPTFPGARWVAQFDALPSQIVLGHGDPLSHSVSVGVLLMETNHPGATIDIVDTLAGMHGAADGLHLTVEETHAKEWMDVRIRVEGELRRFSIVGDQEHWIAYREEGEAWLFVHARGVAPSAVEVVRVDPRNYVGDG